MAPPMTCPTRSSMAMRRTGGAVSALLLASSLPLVLGATKTTTAKWTQTKATVIVKFPLTRGSGKQFTKCTDEAARVEGEPPRFVFTTVCPIRTALIINAWNAFHGIACTSGAMD